MVFYIHTRLLPIYVDMLSSGDVSIYYSLSVVLSFYVKADPLSSLLFVIIFSVLIKIFLFIILLLIPYPFFTLSTAVCLK